MTLFGGANSMKFRIALWALTGVLVAGLWGVFAYATFPSNERMRDLWPLISLTCPVAIAGMHFPISIYQSLVANAITYAFMGLVVEALRHVLHYAK
jgi:hypothetical protein